MNIKGEIIVVEDDQDDRDFLQEIFTSLQIKNKVTFFEDPTLLISYLNSTQTRPFLIFSDINMPKMDGFELRNLLIQNKYISRKYVPYIFLSTSDHPENIEKAYRLFANGYFKKESSFSGYKSMIEKILKYWEQCHFPC